MVGRLKSFVVSTKSLNLPLTAKITATFRNERLISNVRPVLIRDCIEMENQKPWKS